MFKKILVGYDGSKGSKVALRRALVTAGEYQSEITALWVREPLPRHSDLPGECQGEAEAADEYFKERHKEVTAMAEERGVAIRCETRQGHAAKMLLKVAEEGGYDVIVIGHSDHSELWGRMLGDTADRIADHASCSVLIVKN